MFFDFVVNCVEGFIEKASTTLNSKGWIECLMQYVCKQNINEFKQKLWRACRPRPTLPRGSGEHGH